MSYSLNYFKQLAGQSAALLSTLPISLSAEPLETVMQVLKPEVDRVKEQYTAVFNNIQKQTKVDAEHQLSQGLNTIGMLTDRLTILLIREWCLRNKNYSDEAKADNLFATQTTEIMKAMAEAKPGYSSLNSKITGIKADAKATTWEEAYYGLLTTNLLLWESQEVLYIKDIQSLPAEEIRSYIKWFSFGNILRNEYIELCELLYWSSFKS